MKKEGIQGYEFNSELKLLQEYTRKQGKEIEVEFSDVLGKGKLSEEDIKTNYSHNAKQIAAEIMKFLDNFYDKLE